jgi:hypothetical protein
LLRQTDTALWVAVYTPINERVEAKSVLQAFLREMDPALKRAFSGTVAQ